jgi:hypothetical protein
MAGNRVDRVSDMIYHFESCIRPMYVPQVHEAISADSRFNPRPDSLLEPRSDVVRLARTHFRPTLRPTQPSLMAQVRNGEKTTAEQKRRLTDCSRMGSSRPDLDVSE